MRALTVSIDEIAQANEKTQKIIKPIDEIAFQTNLLALNAAVEEAGAGFAVVAGGVRNLSLRSAAAGKDTADLIEGTVKKVHTGSELVNKTNNAFRKVGGNSQKVGNLIAEIATASNEQSQGIQQVNTAVGKMDKVVQGNASSAEESAAASEEMTARAEPLKELVACRVTVVNGVAKG